MRANRLASSIAPSTQWPVETWVIRERDTTPVCQVELYRHQGVWHAWTGSVIRQTTRELGRRLAIARNRAQEAATLNIRAVK